MAMQTSENEQALRKILDMTRLISILILAIHFYYYCYAAFQQWELSSAFSDRILNNIYRTGIFSNFQKSKLIALGFLAISLIGAKGRKDEKLNYKIAFAYVIMGLLIYFLSYLGLLAKIKTTGAGNRVYQHYFHRIPIGINGRHFVIPYNKKQAEQ